MRLEPLENIARNDELSPLDILNLSRHENRPQTQDYVELIFHNTRELHGDRISGDDPTIYTGLVSLMNYGKCMLIGHRKWNREKNIIKPLYYPKPEGYRKALCKMKIAEKFKLPVITFIDTAGADSERGAEISESIARNLLEMSRLRTPILSVIIGEGGSGGALGIGIADRIAMLENSWYAVCTPEACAAILRVKDKRIIVESMKITSRDNLENGIIDYIILEPKGGTHLNHSECALNIQKWLVKNLYELKEKNISQLLDERYEKYRNIGVYK